MKPILASVILTSLLLASCRPSPQTDFPADSVSTTASSPARPPSAITPKPKRAFKATPIPSPAPTSAPELTATQTPRPASKANPAPPILNVSYSDAAALNPNSLALDIYPTDATKCPVIIYIHGGGWWQGDKSHVEAKPAAFNFNGFVFVSVNYRLIQEVEVGQELRDVAAAIAWVKQNIANYGGDPNRIFLMGHSAGAHLVSLVGTDETYLTEQGLSLADLKGIISLDTQAYDVHLLLSNMPLTNGWMYRVAFGDDPENWVRYSPIAYVAPGKRIPPFVVAYTSDQSERHILTDRFADALTAAGIPVVTIAAVDKTHTQINAQFGRDGDHVTELVFDWLEKILAANPIQPTPE